LPTKRKNEKAIYHSPPSVIVHCEEVASWPTQQSQLRNSKFLACPERICRVSTPVLSMVEGCDITDKSALSALVDAVEVGAEVQILQLHTKTWQPGEIRLCELMYGTISRCWITGLFLSVVEYSRAQHSIGMRGHDHA
jgi:hypothetical protein